MGGPAGNARTMPCRAAMAAGSAQLATPAWRLVFRAHFDEGTMLSGTVQLCSHSLFFVKKFRAL